MQTPFPFRLARRNVRPFCAAALALFVAAGLWRGQVRAQTPPASINETADVQAAKPNEAYFGVYLKNTKVGSFFFVRDANARLPGSDIKAVRTDAKTVVDLRIMGANANQVIQSVTWCEPKTGKPLREETVSTASGRKSRVVAVYGERSVTYEATVQGEKKTGTLTLAPGEEFLADPQNGGGAFSPYIGLTIKGKVFIADLLQLANSASTITGEETITVNGQAISAFKVTDNNPVSPSTLFLNRQGDLLRVNTLLDMEIRREPKKMALAAPDKKSPVLDLANLVGIKPSGKPLDNARDLQSATFQINNVTRPLPPPDSVQKPTTAPATHTATVTVTTQNSRTNRPAFRLSGRRPRSFAPVFASLTVCADRRQRVHRPCPTCYWRRNPNRKGRPKNRRVCSQNDCARPVHSRRAYRPRYFARAARRVPRLYNTVYHACPFGWPAHQTMHGRCVCGRRVFVPRLARSVGGNRRQRSRQMGGVRADVGKAVGGCHAP